MAFVTDAFQNECSRQLFAIFFCCRDYAKGWVLSDDEKQWRYELLIYNAKPYDSGTYTCTTPRGQTNSVTVKVQGEHQKVS